MDFNNTFSLIYPKYYFSTCNQYKKINSVFDTFLFSQYVFKIQGVFFPYSKSQGRLATFQ